jgi:lysine-N-methylase
MVQSHVSYRWTTSQQAGKDSLVNAAGRRQTLAAAPLVVPRRKLRAVPVLRFDAEQRFTCQQCGRCCRRGWDIALTAGELQAYRRADAGRFYREREDAAEGAETEPFEPIPGHAAHYRIRKRADGACGFLSPANRCRIHEELGSESKPLTCRLFPFRFHPGEGATVMTASFCCPTIVRNEGAPLPGQARDLAALRKAWSREHAEPASMVELVSGVALAAATLDTLRSVLRRILDRPGPDGAPDLAGNAARMAALLDDLSRHRVVRLKPEALAEYVALVGEHAATTPKPVAARPPSALGRLLFRGFLFVVMAGREQIEEAGAPGLRLALRWRLARLLAHVHGLGPPVRTSDLPAARRAPSNLREAALRDLASNYLRATIEGLGCGRRPVLEEVAVAVAFLNAGCALAAMRAGAAGKPAPDAADFAQGLMEAVDLTHTSEGGLLGRMLATLSGGVESLWMLADGGPFAARTGQPSARAAEE